MPSESDATVTVGAILRIAEALLEGEALERFKKDLREAAEEAVADGVSAGAANGATRRAASASERAGTDAAKNETDRDSANAGEGRRRSSALEKLLSRYSHDEDETAEEGSKKNKDLMDDIDKGVGVIADSGMKALQGSFDFIEQIYGKMKEASPLLQTVSSLIDLAMTLFFLPLGTKLADTLLPAVMDLLDAVVDMWDAFEGKSLGEMFEYAMDYGMEIAGTFLQDIGSTLEEQGGILGAIGSLLNWVGELVENDGLTLLNSIVSVMTFTLEHVKELLSFMVGFYAMEYAMHVAQIYATTMGGGLLSTPMTGAVLATGLVAGTAAYAGLTLMGMAEGGYVPASPGGTVRVLGEGGEGEYVIPESRLSQMGVTNNFYISGLTYADLPDVIDERVNLSISRANVKGSFR